MVIVLPLRFVVTKLPPAKVRTVFALFNVKLLLSAKTCTAGNPVAVEFIVIALPSLARVTAVPPTIFLNCISDPDNCANTPSPALPKLAPVVRSGALRSNSLKFALTFTKASRKSSPVPSFAIVPILTVCIAILFPYNIFTYFFSVDRIYCF